MKLPVAPKTEWGTKIHAINKVTLYADIKQVISYNEILMIKSLKSCLYEITYLFVKLQYCNATLAFTMQFYC